MINKLDSIYTKTLKNIFKKDHFNNDLDKFFMLSIQKFSSSLFLFDDEGNSFSYISILNIFSKRTKSLIKRKLVFCICDNNIFALGGYFCLIASNAVPMMIKLDSSEEQINYLIKKYSPSFIWISKKNNPFKTKYKQIDFNGDYVLLSTNSQEYKLNSSLALLIGTSGSTGNSKFVRLSYRNLISNAFSITKYLEITNLEIAVTTLKPSYTYGLSILHSHFIKGAKIFVTNKTMVEKKFWESIKKHGVTSISGVPYHYQMMKKLKFNNLVFPSLKTITQAGGRLDLETSLYFRNVCKKNKISFYIMYGQSEGTARLAYLSPDNLFNKIESIGKPIPGGELWILDHNNKVIDSSNQKGELVYCGPNVSMGYSNKASDLVKGDDNDFVLRTGDISFRDEDNFFYIAGRLKRFIKLFGHRINLYDLEIWFEKHSYKVICKGEDDLLEIYTNITIKEDFEFTFNQFLKEFKILKSSVKVFLIKEFPIGESGKILYRDLNPSYGERIK